MPRIIVLYLLGVILLTQPIKEIISKCQWLHEDCPKHLIGFYLYNGYYKNGYQMLLENENTIKKAKFQSIKDGRFLKGLQIKIIIHGYTQWRNNDAMINLRKDQKYEGCVNTPISYLKNEKRQEKYLKKYFKNGKWNIIYIDYKKLAEMKCYIKLFWNVPAIGKCGAAFIKKLLELRGKEIKCAQLDVVAFSIGAHIAAQISNNLPFKCLPRITGIDPALPIFFFLPVSSQEKLNRQHAKFVVVIHSNAGVLGVLYSDAHIDIYANNGKIQPGCEIWNYQCSHRRSLEYFAESINSQIGFIATKCDYFLIIFKRCILKSDKTVLVGEYCEPVKSVDEGIYYFETQPQSPYAIGFQTNDYF